MIATKTSESFRVFAECAGALRGPWDILGPQGLKTYTSPEHAAKAPPLEEAQGDKSVKDSEFWQ